MSDEAWRKSLKAGDKVLVSRGGWDRSYNLTTVERVTPTRVVVKGGEAFSISRGHRIGSGTWDTSYIEEVTPERIVEEKERRLRNKRRALLNNAKVPESVEDVKKLIVALEAVAPKAEVGR